MPTKNGGSKPTKGEEEKGFFGHGKDCVEAGLYGGASAWGMNKWDPLKLNLGLDDMDAFKLGFVIGACGKLLKKVVQKYRNKED
jgi:hypothetical protein